MRNKGFTLIDMVVALAVGGVVMLIFMNVISFMRMTERKYQLKADARISRTIGERFLWMGLKNAAPSFNTLNFNDDFGQDFYDLNQDLPTGAVIPGGKTRTIIITKLTPARRFEALITNTNVSDASAGRPSLIYLDPAKLYPMSPTATPSIALDFTMFRDFLLKVNSNFLASTQGLPVFVEVFVPSNFRAAGQSALTPPNSASFFLKYAGGTFTTETFGNRYLAKHAVDPSISIGSLNQFVKQMPSASGGIPPLMARVVRFIRYELTPHPNIPNRSDLWYSTWNGTSFSNRILIADEVEEIKFLRNDISDPGITVELKRKEPKICENPLNPLAC